MGFGCRAGCAGEVPCRRGFLLYSGMSWNRLSALAGRLGLGARTAHRSCETFWEESLLPNGFSASSHPAPKRPRSPVSRWHCSGALPRAVPGSVPLTRSLLSQPGRIASCCHRATGHIQGQEHNRWRRGKFVTWSRGGRSKGNPAAARPAVPGTHRARDAM